MAPELASKQVLTLQSSCVLINESNFSDDSSPINNNFCLHPTKFQVTLIFSECDFIVTPLWQEINTIFDLQNNNIVSDNFGKIFGIHGNSFLTYNFSVLNIIFVYANSRTKTLMFVV